MWCRRHRNGRQRRPSRSNGSCIPPSENVAISHWPKIPNFVFAETDMLPAPALSDLDWRDAELMALAEPFDAARRHLRGVPLPRADALAAAIVARRWPARPSPCPCRRRASSRSRKTRTRQRSRCFRFSHHAQQAVQTVRQRGGRLKADRGQRRHDPGQARSRSRPEARRVQICRPRQPQRSRCPSGPAETCGSGQEGRNA